ncbi:tyramine beta-hydroxylase isoform X1 [Lucilia sericata]|uniref:tyramine beta-hydroxylase isoform X1 n=2 Tax=Lucilia sericata TaxID=13632 RepID=UPI0018A7FE00|nr:tyramine beta-hydroxylase isoform X1 [Lucilia sericata]XP_037815840.1 tyramine beta-hydroxylase isoform X1 [Lucilia sericata]XP_037815841.1 tyramine beta-hydroxylase isoform X1 [Lucilia sericata]XP_037815842.1 tyramine beta-hydroxylase isoform X1 [Lucilia sericata]
MALLAEKLITSSGNTTQSTWPHPCQQQRLRRHQLLPLSSKQSNISSNNDKLQISKSFLITSNKKKSCFYSRPIMNSSWFFVVYLVAAVTLLPLTVMANRLSDTKLHEIYLDNKEIKLSWMVDWYKQEVLFHLQNAFNEQHRWFYLGFSKRGGIGDADICFFENQNGFFNVVTDTYTSPDGKFVHKDYQQDCVLFKMDEYTLAFKRKFDTCDPSDFRMHEGTMYVMWARGEVELELTDYQFPFPNVSSQESGIKMMQLLRADKILIPETDLKHIEITLDEVPVPVKETTYWCHIQKLDDFLQQKHHIVQFEPLITTPGVVHHMEVFHCETDWNVEIPLYNGDCEQLPAEAKVCSKVIALWAMGASTFTYPPETGLPIGGKAYNPYIRLEVHFNNPELEKGHVDSSGLRIKMVSQLRQFDAGVMELGLEYTDKMAIPPGQVAFPLSGYCIAECTELAFPPSGIVVFGSQLHTHLRGVRVLTRHFRGSEELRELNRDDYYSHHFQEMRNLHYKPRVLPGDALVTTCYYNTLGYDNATLGGFSISDEMCVNYMHYYPATKLEVCKSSVSEDTLENYFIYMKKKEHQRGIRLNGARSKNYRSIKWTQPRVDQLYTMYIQEPLSMQCNKSDGFRFEGYQWEGAPITPVQIKIPIHRKLCPNYNPLWLKPLERGECDLLGECIY